MRIVISGGNGYLGRLLERFFVAQGDDVAILTRYPSAPNHVEWDGETLSGWVSCFEGADAVVNLAGRSVNCRYDEDNRREILSSRLETTRLVGEAIRKHAVPIWLNASSATIYRHAEDRPQDEETGEIGQGFSVDVCRQWERALDEADAGQARKTALRTAMVFGPGEGGVFEAFRDLVRRGLGGTMGDGRQRVSWIHHLDFCRAIQWVIGHPLTGPVNLSSPNPLTNAEFLRILRDSMHQRIAIHTTRWMLEVGAQWMGTETELLLKSRWVLPTRLIESGFEFLFPEWDDAVQEILASY